MFSAQPGGLDRAGIYEIVTDLEPTFCLRMQIFLAGPSLDFSLGLQKAAAIRHSLFKGCIKWLVYICRVSVFDPRLCFH